MDGERGWHPWRLAARPRTPPPEMLPAAQPAGGTEVPPRGAPSCGGMAFPRRQPSLPAARRDSTLLRRARRIPAATPRGSIQLTRGGVRGTRARATESASLSAAGLGAAATSADGSVSRLSGSDGEYSLRVGPTKGSPWIRFGRLRSRKCHIVTCQPYVTQIESQRDREKGKEGEKRRGGRKG